MDFSLTNPNKIYRDDKSIFIMGVLILISICTAVISLRHRHVQKAVCIIDIHDEEGVWETNVQIEGTVLSEDHDLYLMDFTEEANIRFSTYITNSLRKVLIRSYLCVKENQ